MKLLVYRVNYEYQSKKTNNPEHWHKAYGYVKAFDKADALENFEVLYSSPRFARSVTGIKEIKL